jgi:hypothetical protein
MSEGASTPIAVRLHVHTHSLMLRLAAAVLVHRAYLWKNPAGSARRRDGHGCRVLEESSMMQHT